jgi:rare lipoprotein A
MKRQYSAPGACAIVALLAWSINPAHARKPAHPAHPIHPTHAIHPVRAQQTAAWIGESGTASWYGPQHHGRRTASGQRFDQEALTAAHPWLPFGTKVRVTLGMTGRSIVVVVTDRLYSTRRVVDLSKAAARELGMIARGIATVSLTPV